jgi:hypothetical protein
MKNTIFWIVSSYSSERTLDFGRNAWPLFSGSKGKPNKKLTQAGGKLNKMHLEVLA